MEPLPITDEAVLRPFKGTDAAELTAVVAANREHLARWLPWAASYGQEDPVDCIARMIAQVEADDGFEGAIVLDGRIVGGAGFHHVDWINRTTSTGYWLATDARGRGLMSATAGVLLCHAFAPWDLHRVGDRSRRRQRPQPGGPGAARLHRGGHPARGEADRRQLRGRGLYAMPASDWPPTSAREAIGSA